MKKRKKNQSQLKVLKAKKVLRVKKVLKVALLMAKSLLMVKNQPKVIMKSQQKTKKNNLLISRLVKGSAFCYLASKYNLRYDMLTYAKKH